MDYAALTAELAKPEYSGLDDPAQAAALLAKPAITKSIAINAVDVRDVLFSRGKWFGIVARSNAARAGTDVSVVAAACQALYDLAQSRAPIDMADGPTSDGINQTLTAMAKDGVIAPEDATALLALTSVDVPYLVSIGLPELAPMDADGVTAHITLSKGGDPQAAAKAASAALEAKAGIVRDMDPNSATFGKMMNMTHDQAQAAIAAVQS